MSGEVLAWLSVWSKVQMICIWSSWCHCQPIISCYSKIQNSLPFWCWLTQVVVENRSLNGCSSSTNMYHTSCQEQILMKLNLINLLADKCHLRRVSAKQKSLVSCLLRQVQKLVTTSNRWVQSAPITYDRVRRLKFSPSSNTTMCSTFAATVFLSFCSVSLLRGYFALGQVSKRESLQHSEQFCCRSSSSNKPVSCSVFQPTVS